jgi:AcrR family transcriptional regulator
MENNVPKPIKTTRTTKPAPGPESVPSAVGLAVDRTLETRRRAARGEVERLVRAAFLVIERSGGLDPKVSDILTEAGLSNQAFYRHFRGKRELLVAVLDEGTRGLADYLGQRMRAASTPTQAVRAWIRGLAAQAQDPNGAQATRPFVLGRGRLAEAFPAEVARSEAQVRAPLRSALEWLRDTRTDSSVSPDPGVDPDRDSQLLYHLLMGWVEARLLEARIPDEEEVAHLERFAMAGLGCGEDASDTSEGLEGTGPAGPRNENTVANTAQNTVQNAVDNEGGRLR